MRGWPDGHPTFSKHKPQELANCPLTPLYAAPSRGTESGDCIVPEEDIVRLIKDHFSASQQKHFLVSVGLNEEKPKASVRNFADAVLALYSSASPKATATPTEGPKE